MKYLNTYLLVVFLCCMATLGFTQQTEELKKINISSSSGSSLILNPGEIEVVASTSLATYNSRYLYSSGSVGGVEVLRNSFSSSSLFLNFGFSQNNVLDAGIGVDYVKSRFDFDALSSPFKVFSSDGLTNSGLSNLRLRLRVTPFANVNTLVFSLNGKIPLSKNSNGQFLGAEKIIIGMGAAFFGNLGANDYFYLQAGLDYGLKHDRLYEDIDFTASLPSNQTATAAAYAIFNLFESKFYVLPGLSYSGSFQTSIKNSDWLQRSHSLLANFVLQYQFSDRLAVTFQQGVPLYFKSHLPAVEFERSTFIVSALSLRFLLGGNDSDLLIDRYLK